MPAFDELITLVTPGPVEFPFTSDGSSDGLELRVFQSNALLRVLRLSVYKGNQRLSGIQGELPAGSIIRIGTSEAVLTKPLTFGNRTAVTPNVEGGLSIFSPWPALDAIAVIVAIAGNADEIRHWAAVETQAISEDVRDRAGSQVIVTTAEAVFVMVRIPVTLDTMVVDNEGNAWNVQGVTHDLGRGYMRLQCTRDVT
ncbi:MAG: hypothetical protein OXI79_13175 [Gammaproteobacteria bacterium]|nr:hypothetical protein [Gammaproteobacteria bacterium]